jgi:ABC-type nitrate/sulfonate/bicarbonate transport system substrate-binding protein
VKALEKAGLDYKDIDAVYLPPADARAAFERGSVDAWVIWDPFFAQAQRDASVRLLTTAEGVAPSNCFVLAARDYAAREGAIVEAAVRDIDDASRWSEAHQDAVAQIIAGLTGVDIATERVTVARSAYGVAFLDDAVIAQQQEIADTFHRLGLIPRAVDVRQAVWRPLGHAASAVR